MGSEARQVRLPLQPRIDSSTTAPLSRETRYHRLYPFIATEEFRTGNEGLFAAVRGELVRTVRKVPEEVRLPKRDEQRVTVAIASGNNKKIDSMLTHITNYQLDVIRIPEAEEWHTKDAIVDATSKAISAARIIQQSEDSARRDVRIRPHVVMANDQLNAIPAVVEDPITHMPTICFERLGKPKSDITGDPVAGVRKTFQQLVAMAEKYNWKTIPYITELATVIHNPADPDNDAVNLQKSAIFLSVAGLKELATDKFDEYVAKVAEQTELSNGKAGVADIAGGLEFQVLDSMGLVEFVSGTVKEIETSGFPPEQRVEAKEHAYRLALGDADGRLIREYFGEEDEVN